MTEEVKNLLNKFNKKKDNNILLQLLKMHGFNFESDYDISKLTIYIKDEMIQVIGTDSSYIITFKDDCIVTTHIFDDYNIEKTYLYDNLNNPIYKVMSINIANNEKIYYSEDIVLNLDRNKYDRLRTLEKAVTYNDMVYTVFSKTFTNSVEKADTKRTSTEINSLDSKEKEYNHHEISVRNLNNIFEYSSVKYDTSNVINTNFHNEITNKSNITINIKKNDSQVEIEINKNNSIIKISLDDKRREPQSRCLFSTNNDACFTTDDIDDLINFFSEEVKEDVIIIDELKEIKYTLIKNKLYKEGVRDTFDLYFDEHFKDSFEKVAFELYSDIKGFNAKIEKIINKSSESVQLEFKNSLNRL